MNNTQDQDQVLKTREYRGFRIEVTEGINNPFWLSIPELAPAWFKSIKDLMDFIDDKLASNS